MLVSIVGSPASGKTTTAAKAFAWMKDRGMFCEFIMEQARVHIAAKKDRLQQAQVSLDDNDQIEIMEAQLELERLMKASVTIEDAYVISDSSSLNALMYMSPEVRESPKVQEMVKKALSLYDRVYYSEPFPVFVEGDPNRLHDSDFSKKFDDEIWKLCNDIGLTFAKILRGSSDLRMQMLINNIILGE